MTWQYLSSHSGAVMMTGLITQLFKDLGFLKRIPTRLLSWGVATLLLGLATLFTVGFDLSVLAMSPINGVIVSLAGNGMYDALTTKRGEVSKPETE